jgi:hypothetical protein
LKKKRKRKRKKKKKKIRRLPKKSTWTNSATKFAVSPLTRSSAWATTSRANCSLPAPRMTVRPDRGCPTLRDFRNVGFHGTPTETVV